MVPRKDGTEKAVLDAKWAQKDRQESIAKAILHMERHAKNFRLNWNREYRAWKSLIEAEKNQIICELILPF